MKIARAGMPAENPEEIVIGGLVPMTTTDYPGQLATVLFLQGCPWRCGYCHNPHLQRTGAPARSWNSVLAFLARRRGLLDAVVFSGGEPTAQPGLARALEDVRTLGFRTGLHTAGIYPRRLASALPLLDWVALDIKAGRSDYDGVTGCGTAAGERAYASLRMVLEGARAYEIRTTVHSTWIDEPQTLTLGLRLAGMGVAHYALQEYRPPRGLMAEASLAHEPLSDALCERLRPHFETFTVRRAM